MGCRKPRHKACARDDERTLHGHNKSNNNNNGNGITLLDSREKKKKTNDDDDEHNEIPLHAELGRDSTGALFTTILHSFSCFSFIIQWV